MLSGRCIVVDFGAFYLVNTYVPNSGMTEDSEARRETWDANMLSKVAELAASVCMLYEYEHYD